MKKNILDFPKSKKGVSVLIGYVLLVVFAIVLSVVVYAWLKTYVPGDTLSCPDSISVFIKEASFNETTSILKLILINNGRFDIAGYFIRATNSSNQNQAIIDISSYLDTNYGGEVVGNSVLFSSVGGNVLKPGNQKTSIFNISSEIGKPYSIRIIPVRYQTENNRERFVSCGGSVTLQTVGEPIPGGVPGFCTPDCSGRVCGSDGCGGTCPPDSCDPSTEFCDAAGQCILNTCVPATDPTFSGVCGTQQCGYATNGTAPNDCGSVLCGTCPSGYGCNVTYQCEVLCGNGVLDTGEVCDGGINCIAPGQPNQCTCPSGYIADGSLGCTTIGNGVCDAGETCAQEPACEGQQATCSIGQSCQSGICVWKGGVYTENEYCIDIGQEQGLGYTSGDCTTPGFCNNQVGANEDDEPGAETYCPGQPQPILCCFPRS